MGKYTCEGGLKGGGWLKLDVVKHEVGKVKVRDTLLTDPKLKWYKKGDCNTYYVK